MLAFSAADRDPAVLPEPDCIILDRADNCHAALGLQIHRCAGSNLAGMELKIAIEPFHQRIARLRTSGPLRWPVDSVRGPRRLPMAFC